MTALDTNILVRFAVRDDAEQFRRADRLLRTPGHTFYVADVVLVELAWVLRRVYRATRPDVLNQILLLLDVDTFVVDDPAVVRAAADRYAAGRCDFADYLLAERSRASGCDRVATFDRKLSAEPHFFLPEF